MLMLERKSTRDKMANNKMKGLFRGLRYISQIFDNEKEPEMQIGTPTDVKHVAHIGWDGPSVNNTPSWMNEFKSPSGDSGQQAGDGKDDSNAKGISEDSSRKGNSRVKDLPGLPKSSKKSAIGSPTKEKSDKTKRRSSTKDAADGSTRPSRRPKENSRHTRDSSSRQNGPLEAPKKSKKNKSKESAGGGSTRSSRRVPASDTDQMSDCMSDSGSVISVSNNDDERAGY